MALSAVPVSIRPLSLTNSHQVVYKVPTNVPGAKVLGINICNVDPGITHNIWLNKVPAGGSPVAGNAILFNVPFNTIIAGDGIITLEPGESIQAKADGSSVVTISLSGEEMEES